MSKRLPRINGNKLAREVAELEDGLEEVNIAQIKDVINALLYLLANGYERSQVVELLEKYDERIW